MFEFRKAVAKLGLVAALVALCGAAGALLQTAIYFFETRVYPGFASSYLEVFVVHAGLAGACYGVLRTLLGFGPKGVLQAMLVVMASAACGAILGVLYGGAQPPVAGGFSEGQQTYNENYWFVEFIDYGLWVGFGVICLQVFCARLLKLFRKKTRLADAPSDAWPPAVTRADLGSPH